MFLQQQVIPMEDVAISRNRQFLLWLCRRWLDILMVIVGDQRRAQTTMQRQYRTRRHHPPQKAQSSDAQPATTTTQLHHNNATCLRTSLPADVMQQWAALSFSPPSV